MEYFDSPNVYYLEDTEFDSNYTLRTNVVNERTGAPFFSGVTIVLVQGNYCGHCTSFKPVFQQLADELAPQGIDFATIQIDGKEPGEQGFQDSISSIIQGPLEGVPLILKFYQGKPVDKHNGDRSAEAVRQWALA